MIADIPHLAQPLRFATLADGTLAAAVTEQDSIDEVADCVGAILRTPEGWRDDRPDFGTPDLAFASPVDLDDLETIVERWEPRASTTLDVSLAEFVADLHMTVSSRTDDS